MKYYWVTTLMALLLAESLLGQPAASVTISCTSLRFPPASGGPGQAQTLSLTTDPTLAEINNELMPLSDPTLPGYGALFVLGDPTAAGSVTGQIFFDPPPRVDANSDGFDDFLQWSQQVGPVTTQGLFNTVVDQGTVTATWGRAAGSTTGTCTVQMTGKAFGQLAPFTFTFELLSYTGALTYTPATNSVTGFLSLTNLSSASNRLTGPMTFIRVTSDRLNDLTLLPGTLTNQAGQAFSYPAENIQRDTTAKTNYYGYLDFADGDPSTSTADFQTWIVSIDDSNDANGNGVPDLSDDPGIPVTGQPSLAVVRAGNQLLLSIAAGRGHSYDLEQTQSLGKTNWTKAVSITVTNDPQTISLPSPTSPTDFWRLQSQ